MQSRFGIAQQRVGHLFQVHQHLDLLQLILKFQQLLLAAHQLVRTALHGIWQGLFAGGKLRFARVQLGFGAVQLRLCIGQLLPPLENPPLRAAVITLSDKGSRGEREDKSGPLIVEMLTAAGYVVEETMILPDEAKALKAQLIRLADGRQVNLILTTGGTGFSPRDITPEATCAVADRNAPGIAEAMRYHSLSITPRGMLSRGVSVLRGKTLIVNLPGSPKAVQENLEYILPSLEHGVRIAAGLDGECARK